MDKIPNRLPKVKPSLFADRVPLRPVNRLQAPAKARAARQQYAGLTDDPQRRRSEHGNPSNWRQQQYATEAAARLWEREMHAQGYEGDEGGEGWRYGYVYTITPDTKQ